MMAAGHASVAFPFAITAAFGAITVAGAPIPVGLGMGLITWCSCNLPDLDHPRASVNNYLGWFSRAIGRIVRVVSWYVWVFTKTRRDKPNPTWDCHRDFTHSIEGCALFGAVVAASTAWLPYLSPYWLYWGFGVFVGCMTHVVSDGMTPSGVPLSMLYNRVVHGKTWVRYCIGYRMLSTRWWLMWLKVPAVHRLDRPRKHGEWRGLFSTNSGGERVMAFIAMWPMSIALLLTYVGALGPLFNALLGW